MSDEMDIDVPDSPGGKLVKSVTFTLIARIAMIAGSLALPIGGWMLQRGINSIDEVGRKVDNLKDQEAETHSTVKLIQQTQSVQTQLLADHEARVRMLERLTPPRQLQP